HMIENVVGVFSLPLGIATNFLIDERDVPIPMAVEETSIVAAASAAAKWIRRNGGFHTRAIGRLIIGQIQFPSITAPEAFEEKVNAAAEDLIDTANQVVPNLVSRGGGVREIKVRLLERPDQRTMAVLHVLCDPCDAMGANLINQICEGLKKPLEVLTGEQVGLCILSNLVDTKMVEATCEIRDIEPTLGRAIEEATLFANLDPYRCATHNKGVMNGIDPILIATGNDWRAVEAGIHAYVALGGEFRGARPAAFQQDYRSITHWEYTGDVLKGRLLAPIVVGTVGGVTKIHPTANTCLKMLGVSKAEDLARICAAVGLGQNFAALRALCGEGIVRGHMRLHATNLAIAAGAAGHEVATVEERLRKETRITLSRAKEILSDVRDSVPAVPPV
ncbi:MAG TPA: hydroxymethylglutaryl-CoA reductase, degradative, partial [Oligoflexia bacterium]|nr:hydroxymethylglutaryl-CoA reductase, degradative [Oligoflexia bacterium]